MVMWSPSFAAADCMAGASGWIDAHLLASSLVGRLKLWTTDPRLIALARELGVSYE
jgi:hypothetical protein